MYRLLSKFYPAQIRESYNHLLLYSAIKIKPERFIGFIFIFGFLLALTISLYAAIFFGVSLTITFFILFAVFQLGVYFWLLLKADAKAKFVESILPDVLQLMSSNLRSGLTTDRALLLAARPEFGPFQDEINLVGKEITMGKDIDESLIEMAKRTKSQKLSKTVDLIVAGLRAGGELASLLDQTARNLRREAVVDSRIRANVMMYVIFIFVAVCFGAPLLFGLSSFLVEVLTKILGSINMPENMSTSMPFTFNSVSISPGFVIFFSITFLLTSSVMGSFIIGLISKGKEREGIKFIPLVGAASLLIFFIARIAIKAMLGNLLGV
jgi:pilus assembly protein TadC